MCFNCQKPHVSKLSYRLAAAAAAAAYYSPADFAASMYGYTSGSRSASSATGGGYGSSGYGSSGSACLQHHSTFGAKVKSKSRTNAGEIFVKVLVKYF